MGMRLPGGRWWLRLPRLMWDAQLWVGGKQIDLSPHRLRMELMEFDVELPLADAGSRVEVLLRVDCGASQYGKGDHQGHRLNMLLAHPENPGTEIPVCSHRR